MAAKPSGKGGGVYVQIETTTPAAVFRLPLASIQVDQDPRLGEDTESDDLGAHFSPSGAQLITGVITLHRRNANYPEALSLTPGLEIARLWYVWGAALIGGTPVQKGVMIYQCTLGNFSDDIAEIAPNMPVQIRFQGGAIYRDVKLPAVGATPAASPILPSGS